VIVKYTEESTPLYNRRGITSMAYEAIVPSSLHSFRFREMSKAPYSKQCDACIPERHHRVLLPSVPKTMHTNPRHSLFSSSISLPDSRYRQSSPVSHPSIPHQASVSARPDSLD